jgi:hypothetical protein
MSSTVIRVVGGYTLWPDATLSCLPLGHHHLYDLAVEGQRVDDCERNI